MSLADLQREFTAYLRSDTQVPLPSVSDHTRRGLPVYHFAYRASLLDALRDVYERVHVWMGDELFDAAAKAHIAAQAPSTWTLADYGRGFEGTLSQCHPDHPELPELAWLDWSLRTAFNGRDARPLDTARLAQIDWDAAALELAPTLVMRPIVTNVAPIWVDLDEDKDADPPIAALLDEPAVLTVWRQELMPRFHTVTPAEAAALEAARQGMPFGRICEHYAGNAASAEDGATQAGAMLGRWISEGLLVGVR